MTPNNLVHENERLDELHRNGYYIIQDPARFCFGMDAVLLSGFAVSYTHLTLPTKLEV